MKKIFTILLLLNFLLTGCKQKTEPGENIKPGKAQQLTVLAAASLTESFSEIGKKFEEANPGVKIVFNFAGSQALFRQLEQGIPADVFSSANETYMRDANEAGFVDEFGDVTFARNALIVIFPKSNPGRIASLADLSKPGLKIVIAAEEVPVGKYTVTFLENASKPGSSLAADFKDGFLANVVSFENTVKSVVSKVLLGEADAGIVYYTDLTGTAREELNMLEIPTDLNVIATYPIAVLKSSQNAVLAHSFIDFVVSDQGQAILHDYGFLAP